MTLRIRLAAGLALAASLMWVTTPVAAQDDLEAQRDDVRQRQAALAAELDATRASDADVRDALNVMGEELRSQRTGSQEAERAATAARQQLEATRSERAQAQAELDAARAKLRDAAIAGYINPSGDSQLAMLFGSGPRDAAVQDVLTRTVVRSTGDALDQLRAAETRLGRAEAAAVEAEAAASARDSAAQAQLGQLNSAYDQQAQLLESVATRLDGLLSESASLSARDVDLTAQLDLRQQELIAQAAAAAQAAEAAKAEASAARDGWTEPPTAPLVSETRSGYNVPLATVGGIEVHADIAGQLGAMLAAAAADGIALTGGGWRSPDEQIAIRREVCGTSEYAIWEMPSWECSPPVARPGRSMHEQGLAIDFTGGGDLIRSRSHPAFLWLDANAARFGFYNLPSEPWHWSTTGS